jgi:hypothetical protein
MLCVVNVVTMIVIGVDIGVHDICKVCQTLSWCKDVIFTIKII